jgi:uncharacterized RDD family membrane protein YckC
VAGFNFLCVNCHPMSIIQIGTPFNIDLEFEIAEFHKRLFAYIIDFVLLIIYLYSMKTLLYKGFGLDSEGGFGVDVLVISTPMFLYSLLTELWMNGQTIGKKIMAIRVISLEGGEPTFGQYLTRWIMRFWEWPFLFGYIAFVEYALIAYIMITGFIGIVVNTKTNLSLQDTVFMQVTNTDYKVMFPEVMRLSDRDINTIKSVVTQANKKGNYDMCNRVAMKVQDVLKVQTSLYANDFLEKLLEDYNYLATKE